MEFAYGVNGPPQLQRDIIIPLGMAFFMLISCLPEWRHAMCWQMWIQRAALSINVRQDLMLKWQIRRQ
jgi:hypothetical protein